MSETIKNKVMLTRIKQVFNKLLFCMKVSGNTDTFFSLIKETRRQRQANNKDETAHVYRLNVTGEYTDVHLRTSAGDIVMLYEIFLYRSYSFDGMDVFHPRIIMDLGAHIGMSALYFQSKYPAAAVYSIEPDTDNFELLKKNTVSNPHITALQAAVSDMDGAAVVAKSRYGYNSVVLAGDAAAGNPIRTMTMPTLFNELHISTIDLLKVDIEGYEKKIFSGNTDWLFNVSRIIIEVHSPEDEAVCTAALRRHNFSIVKLGKIADNILYAVKEAI